MMTQQHAMLATRIRARTCPITTTITTPMVMMTSSSTMTTLIANTTNPRYCFYPTTTTTTTSLYHHHHDYHFYSSSSTVATTSSSLTNNTFTGSTTGSRYFCSQRKIDNDNTTSVETTRPTTNANNDFTSDNNTDTSRSDDNSVSTASSLLLMPPYQPFQRVPMEPYPHTPTTGSSSSSSSSSTLKYVPPYIVRPNYAKDGNVPFSNLMEQILLHEIDTDEYNSTSSSTLNKMRYAAKVAANALQYACSLAVPGITTDEIDTLVHNELIHQYQAYPSPLNYCHFPKSICTSINEIICHGIPDTRVIQYGDVISFDISCYVNGVHGDNCATIIVGDQDYTRNDSETNTLPTTTTPTRMDWMYRHHSNSTYTNSSQVDWRNVPYRSINQFASKEELEHFQLGRRLIQATYESLYAGIRACKPDQPLNSIGDAIQDIADEYGYSSVRKYRGHGIGPVFHSAPFVKHYREKKKNLYDPDHDLLLRPGMIFTIEPMFVTSPVRDDCYEWDTDHWTVSAIDTSVLAAQFEHTVLITNDGVEILTLPDPSIIQANTNTKTTK